MYHTFALSLSIMSLPRSYQEALQINEWKSAIDEEMSALQSRGTWDLVSTLSIVEIINCK